MSGDKAFSPRILRNDGMMRIPYVSPEMLDRQRDKEDPRTAAMAPWRSLLYRNVDTPFTYVADGALFPKMPLHVPGYDPRVRQIMGEWMASLPAREIITGVAKNGAEQTYEEVFDGEADFEQAQVDAEARLDAYRESGRYSCVEYSECLKDLANCTTPCVDTRDIVSHDVLGALRTGTGDFAPQNYARDPAAGIPERPHWVNSDLTEPTLDHWEPRRADWPEVLLVEAAPVAPPGGAYPSTSASSSASASASTSTSASGSSVASGSASASASASTSALRVTPNALDVWSALGAGGSSEWIAQIQAVGGSGNASPSTSASTSPSTSTSASASASTTTTLPSTSASTSTSSSASGGSTEPPPPDPNDPSVIALEAVRQLRLTDDFKELALGERPMWFWETEDHDCDLSEEPTTASYTGSAAAGWFETLNEAQKNQPLYLQSPGEAVFSNICMNCHGPQADSRGRQAATVALMSGGETRVANLRDGLFGAGNIEAQFGPFVQEAGVSADELAVRYMSWMALGGTQRRIPAAILELVRRTKVFGSLRNGSDSTAASPNMLEAAARFCGQLMPDLDHEEDLKFEPTKGLLIGGGSQPFIAGGDHQMWFDLCTYDNPQPVLVLSGKPGTGAWGDKGLLARRYVKRNTANGRPTMPEDWPVGNQRGETHYTLDADNRAPWCVEKPAPDSPDWHKAAVVFAGSWEDEHGYEVPWCPSEVLGELGVAYEWNDVERLRFSTRGAANAGMAVFVYLQAVIQQDLAPRPAFNRCEEL
jgi:mono/diheme cytochrome c family protein